MQGGQLRGSAPSVNPELNYVGAPLQNVQNGASQQVPSRGMIYEIHEDRLFITSNLHSLYGTILQERLGKF